MFFKKSIITVCLLTTLVYNASQESNFLSLSRPDEEWLNNLFNPGFINFDLSNSEINKILQEQIQEVANQTEDHRKRLREQTDDIVHPPVKKQQTIVKQNQSENIDATYPIQHILYPPTPRTKGRLQIAIGFVKNRAMPYESLDKTLYHPQEVSELYNSTEYPEFNGMTQNQVDSYVQAGLAMKPYYPNRTTRSLAQCVRQNVILALGNVALENPAVVAVVKKDFKDGDIRNLYLDEETGKIKVLEKND